MFKKFKDVIKEIGAINGAGMLRVFVHSDSESIITAAIFLKALARWDKQFTLDVTEDISSEFFENVSENDVLIFIDLNLIDFDCLEQKDVKIFIFSYLEILEEIPKNVFILNCDSKISNVATSYLFAKQLDIRNKNLAGLALIGMVGNFNEREIDKVFSEIIDDAECIVKRGLLIYPSTYPLDKVLEYSSTLYLPSITGSKEGVLEVLRETGLRNEKGKYKSIYELSKDEMGKLITSIILKTRSKIDQSLLVGNLFLMKFFNKLEDAREISSLINACCKMNCAEVALGFCLGNKFFRKEAEKIYANYKKNIVVSLKYPNGQYNLEGFD